MARYPYDERSVGGVLGHERYHKQLTNFAAVNLDDQTTQIKCYEPRHGFDPQQPHTLALEPISDGDRERPAGLRLRVEKGPVD